jgi:hypothetical protein
MFSEAQAAAVGVERGMPACQAFFSAVRSQDRALERAVVRTLTYFDIWEHPLTAEELFAFLPVEYSSLNQFRASLHEAVRAGVVKMRDKYYYLSCRDEGMVARRIRRESHARMLWRFARLSTHIIKRFPFVRAIMISGDLSKNSTDRKSDIDFFIITAPGRLWITRSLLILFKKIVFLNSKKIFCLNSFVSEDHLVLEDRNIYQAVEVATLKPVYRSEMSRMYLVKNGWLQEFFPNFETPLLDSVPCGNRRSLLQQVLEVLFHLLPADRLDRALQSRMEQIWARRYPEFDSETRRKIFRTTRTESRAYASNFEQKILSLYQYKLQEQGVGSE